MNISTSTEKVATSALSEYLLRLGDSSLVLGHRLSEWCGHGPILEEDIAMTNIALDFLGQARLLLSLSGELEGQGRDEDRLAYWRDADQYRNFTLCELPNSGIATGRNLPADYAVTIARNFLYVAYQLELLQALARSRHETLRGIAHKAYKESSYHFEHAMDWMIRLGQGTADSHRRMTHALNQLWSYTNELFYDDEVDKKVAEEGMGVLGSTLRDAWMERVLLVLSEAGLEKPPANEFLSKGKSGQHTEHLGLLLAEMQVLARAHPGAVW